MIKNYKTLKKYVFTIVLLCLFIPDAKCEDSDNFHYRRLYPIGRFIKFSNVPADLPLITRFPLNELKASRLIKSFSYSQGYAVIEYDSGKGVKGSLMVDYYVHSSIDDAEDFVAERRHSSSTTQRFTLDLSEPIVIGDNCWVAPLRYDLITFIRNNVVVYIKSVSDGLGVHSPEANLEFAYMLDDLLQKSETVSDSKLMSAPVIDSMVLTNGPYEPEKDSDFQVNARDLEGRNLLYRLYRGIWSSWSPESLVHFKDDQYFPAGKMKVWVMNEDKMVSSMEYF